MAHHQIFGKAALTIVWLVLSGCGSSGGDDAGGGGPDQASSGSGTTSAGGTSSSNGSDAGTSTGEASGGATSGGQTHGTSTTAADGGAGGGASSTRSANTSGADSSGSGGGCEEVSCLRPYECAVSCDAEPSYVGCCPCAEGQIDQFTDCDQDADACGGGTCQADEYCEKPAGQCDASDATGSCAPMPAGCTLEYAPVCGCDGVTYGNSCGAASAGVNVASTGECE